jgi:hypothetical protein
MSRPEEPLGAISDLTSETQDPPGQTNDQICPGEIERRRADDAEAVRNAQARIDNAIRVIGSFPDQQPLPKLPRAANLRSRQPNVADRLPSTSASPPVDHFAGFEAPSQSGYSLQVMPPPPEGPQRPIIGRLLSRYAPMVGFAAIVAYGITMLGPFQSDGSKTDNDSGAQVGRMSNGPAGGVRPLLRLVIKNEQAFANEPILLGVAVAPPTDSGSLSLRGLAHGTRLSTGTALGGDSWEFPLRHLGGVYVYAPSDFTGVMNAMIALLSPSKKVIDSHPMRLEWMAKADSPQLSGKQEIDSGTANTVPKIPIESGPPSLVAKPQIDSGTVSAAPVKPLDQQEAAALMERGRDLLRNGDVALAQLAFRRLAEAGDAEAALALAITYDPRYLAEQKLIGINGDEAKARAWYQRASELGSIEADRVLQRENIK